MEHSSRVFLVFRMLTDATRDKFLWKKVREVTWEEHLLDFKVTADTNLDNTLVQALYLTFKQKLLIQKDSGQNCDNIGVISGLLRALGQILFSKTKTLPQNFEHFLNRFLKSHEFQALEEEINSPFRICSMVLFQRVLRTFIDHFSLFFRFRMHYQWKEIKPVHPTKGEPEMKQIWLESADAMIQDEPTNSFLEGLLSLPLECLVEICLHAEPIPNWIEPETVFESFGNYIQLYQRRRLFQSRLMSTCKTMSTRLRPIQLLSVSFPSNLFGYYLVHQPDRSKDFRIVRKLSPTEVFKSETQSSNQQKSVSFVLHYDEPKDKLQEVPPPYEIIFIQDRSNNGTFSESETSSDYDQLPTRNGYCFMSFKRLFDMNARSSTTCEQFLEDMGFCTTFKVTPHATDIVLQEDKTLAECNVQPGTVFTLNLRLMGD